MFEHIKQILEGKSIVSQYEYQKFNRPQKTKHGEVIGVTKHSGGLKGANIIKMKTGKYFAAAGSTNRLLPGAKTFDSAKEAADFYHRGTKAI